MSYAPPVEFPTSPPAAPQVGTTDSLRSDGHSARQSDLSKVTQLPRDLARLQTKSGLIAGRMPPGVREGLVEKEKEEEGYLELL